VKSLMKFAVQSFFLMLSSLCLAQTGSNTQTTPQKAGSSPSASAVKEQAKPEEEDVVPPVGPNAIFPAVVARVNGKPILGRDLELQVHRELIPIGSPEWKNLREDYRGELTLSVITNLINTELIYQKAIASGIKVTDAEVQAEMKKISETFKSDAEMNAALANQLTDRTSLEKSLYKRLVVDKYVDENVNKKIEVTPEEVTKYYVSNPAEFQHPDIVRTSHILLPAGETAAQDALAKQRAEALLERAKKGEDFAKLAKDYSTDSSASQGGDLGFTSREALDPEYAEMAFSLPVGGVGLVKTQFGYHIVKVTEKKKEGLSTLDEIKPQLTEFLKNQKGQEDLAKLVNQLRDKAKAIACFAAISTGIV
jgi:parvulin-like peptidyl-prolyl isomerase